MDKVIFGERAPVERNCRTRSGIPLVLLNVNIRPAPARFSDSKRRLSKLSRLCITGQKNTLSP